MIRNQTNTVNPQDEKVSNTLIEMNREFLPSEYVEDEEKRNLVMEVMDKLPDHYRESLFLFYYERMSYQEIAEVMQSDKKKVDNDLQRAKAVLKREVEKRVNKTFLLSTVPAGSVATLTRLFEADQQGLITDQRAETIWNEMQGRISQFEWGNKTAESVKQFSKNNVVRGIVAGAAITAVVAGIFLKQQSVKEEPAQEKSVTVTEEADQTEEPEEIIQIETLTDMIGSEDAEVLQGFAGQTSVDEAAWQEFLARIEATPADQAIEYEYEYTMYHLEKQDKQLILAQRNRVNGDEIQIRYQFHDIEELPRMIRVVLMFDTQE